MDAEGNEVDFEPRCTVNYNSLGKKNIIVFKEF